MIRLTVPSIDESDLQIVREVMESGYLVQGTYVQKFEETIAKYVDSNYAVAVSNCTAALQLSLLATDLQPDDIVIVTAYSYPATANVIELVGGRPVFVDIDPDTFNMDPNCLADMLKKIFSIRENAKKVKVILPVHTFGQMADMPAILEISDRYNVAVVEDAACALGAAIGRKSAGVWGTIGCFSFHPRKAITTGEGGMVVTSNSNLVNRIRALRNHGLDPESPSPDFIMAGFNYRMTEFQAGLGLAQMAKLDRIISKRRQLADYYSEAFRDTVITPPISIPNFQHVFQSYVVLLPLEISSQRSELISDLRHEGIETTIGTWHIPMTTYYRQRYGYKPGDFPNADEIFSRSLTIPLYESLTNELQTEVIDKLTSWVTRRI